VKLIGSLKNSTSLSSYAYLTTSSAPFPSLGDLWRVDPWFHECTLADKRG